MTTADQPSTAAESNDTTAQHEDSTIVEPSWVGVGEVTAVERPNERETILVTAAEVEDEMGFIDVVLDAQATRQLHAVLADIIAEQDGTDGQVEHVAEEGEIQPAAEDDAQDSEEAGRTRFERMTDPAGVTKLTSFLSRPSGLGGFEWGHLVFFAVISLAALSMILRTLT